MTIERSGPNVRRLTVACVFSLLAAFAGDGAARGDRLSEGPFRLARRHASPQPVLVYRGRVPRLALKDVLKPQPARPELTLEPSYYQAHADRVQRDFLSFSFEELGQNPSVHPELTLIGQPQGSLMFVGSATTEDPLQQLRDLDRLALFRVPPRLVEGSAVAVGVSMFVTAVVAAAHAPRALRFLFDGSPHLGPAIFQGGGAGAGVGASF